MKEHLQDGPIRDSEKMDENHKHLQCQQSRKLMQSVRMSLRFI